MHSQKNYVLNVKKNTVCTCKNCKKRELVLIRTNPCSPSLIEYFQVPKLSVVKVFSSFSSSESLYNNRSLFSFGDAPLNLHCQHSTKVHNWLPPPKK